MATEDDLFLQKSTDDPIREQTKDSLIPENSMTIFQQKDSEIEISAENIEDSDNEITSDDSEDYFTADDSDNDHRLEDPLYEFTKADSVKNNWEDSHGRETFNEYHHQKKAQSHSYNFIKTRNAYDPSKENIKSNFFREDARNAFSLESSYENLFQENKTIHESDLQIGDILEFERNKGPIRYHHCGNFGGNGTVIHIGTPPGVGGMQALRLKWNNDIRYRIDAIQDVAQGSKVYRNNMLDHIIRPTIKEIKTRAMAMYSEANYDLFFNNCQHFCTRLRYNMALSIEADNLMKSLFSTTVKINYEEKRLRVILDKGDSNLENTAEYPNMRLNQLEVMSRTGTRNCWQTDTHLQSTDMLFNPIAHEINSQTVTDIIENCQTDNRRVALVISDSNLENIAESPIMRLYPLEGMSQTTTRNCWQTGTHLAHNVQSTDMPFNLYAHQTVRSIFENCQTNRSAFYLQNARPTQMSCTIL